MSINKEGRLAYCAHNLIVLRNIKNINEVETFKQHKNRTCCVRFNSCGNWVISGDIKGTIIIWEADKNYPIRKLYENVMKGMIRDVCWTGDSKRFMVAGEGTKEFGRALLVDTGSQCGIINGSTRTCLSIDVTKDRPYLLAITGEDQAV
jgi:WD40 repeat protein